MKTEHHPLRINWQAPTTRQPPPAPNAWLALLWVLFASMPVFCTAQEMPCIRVTKSCDVVPVGSPNFITGVVTNCGNVTLTNIVLSDNLYGTLATFSSLAAGASQFYGRSVFNSCGAFPNIVTASGSSVGGTPVAAQASATCIVLESPCILATTTCNTVVIGSSNTISGMVTNCGNVTLTNISVMDDLYGPLATMASLAPGGSAAYSRLVTNNCGNFTNTVTASGRSGCGTLVTARATNACVVTCRPLLTNPMLAGGQFSFSFATAPGRTNAVEYTDSISPANWLPLTNFLGDGATRTVADAVSAQGRFYRVLVQ